MPSDSQTIVLPDGRTLGYAEYGCPNGTPLLYFHGFPSSRVEAYPFESIASRRNIRIISIDRPGFGLSTYQPNRRIMDWPVDVQAFASELGLSRFAILGVSGGGPYALACAKQLPGSMLTAVGILAGAPLWDRGFWTEGVPWYARFVYLAATYWPSGLKAASLVLVGTMRWIMTTRPVERKIDGLLEALTKAKAAKEKTSGAENSLEKIPLMATVQTEEEEMLQEPVPSVPTAAQRRERLMGVLFGGFVQGSSGFVQESQLLSRDWGFKFEDVTYEKVQMWHGSKDVNAPVKSIRDMAERMPHGVLKEYDDNDHFSMGHHLEEVIEELMPEMTGP